MQLRSLLSISQRKFSHKIADRAISASESESSVNEDDNTMDMTVSDWGAPKNEEDTRYSYLDDVLGDLTNENRRFLCMYLKIQNKIDE